MLRSDAQEDELVFICPGSGAGIPATSRDAAQDHSLHHCDSSGGISLGILGPRRLATGMVVHFLLGGLHLSRHLPFPARTL